MILYFTLGTNDLARAGSFYDELLAGMDAKRVMELDRFIAWSNAPGAPMLAVIKPIDGQPATVGNGVMAALHVGDTAKIDALHAKALALGAKDEGAPGFRMGTFYAAYFRDLDGNKLALVKT
ncbi:MAG TPA: VOC family protein [Candidatus Nanopelagicales bacterium]|nr:VOC family protein [Candidatus Nanopelagicales bacterium]